MRRFLFFTVLCTVWPWATGFSQPPRSWTLLVDYSGQYLKKQLGASPDPRTVQNFKVPGAGLLRTTFVEMPFHSTQVRRPDTGVFEVSPSEGGAQLGYPALFRYQEPKVEQDGVAARWCSVGEVLKGQPAWVSFCPPVSYPSTWQWGCKFRMVVEYSPGALTPGEKVEPSAAFSGQPGNEKRTGKVRTYEVGIIDEAGGRSQAIAPPWVIYPDGKIVGPGVWHATYSSLPDGTLKVKLSLDSNGAQDDFTLQLTDTGFTAFKNGKPYRWGRLIRSE